MKLYYGYTRAGNFGDDLNPWLMPKLFPGLLDDRTDEILIGIGTLLNHKVPRAPKKMVFGAGYGYGRIPEWNNESWEFYAVRGPLTAKMLGLGSNVPFGDPAYLVPDFLRPASVNDMASRIMFMPHYESIDRGPWREIAEEAGMGFLDPRQPVGDTLAQIQSASVVISEAMHGVIMSDALRVPWIAIRPTLIRHRLKWTDWSQSIEVEPRFVTLGPSSTREMWKSVSDRASFAAKSTLYRTPLWRHAVDMSPQTEDLSFHTVTPHWYGREARRTKGEGHDLLSLRLKDEVIKRLRVAGTLEPQLSSEREYSALRARLNDAAEHLKKVLQSNR